MQYQLNRIIKRCEVWRNRLLYYLKLKPSQYNIEMVCHSSSYLISWLNELQNYDEDSYEKYLSNVKILLKRASETIFNYYYIRCKRYASLNSKYSKKYIKSVKMLLDHVYYVLWCSYYAENDSFIENVCNIIVWDIAKNLPPTLSMKDKRDRLVGRNLWELMIYFEKFLDYEIPEWAIQKFQTESLIKPKIAEEETYNIMAVLDEIEESNPSISSDLEYRMLRNELLWSTEFGSKERRKILKKFLRQRCECGHEFKIVKSDLLFDIKSNDIIIYAKSVCRNCGKMVVTKKPVEKTRMEFDALDKLDEYLYNVYQISLIDKVKAMMQKQRY
ncbi:MAG: hypothetical protein N3F64_06870 [Nitrososphaeria archaeon]|nr:hypothetical protein [Nitrososphaeria archaeon]